MALEALSLTSTKSSLNFRQDSPLMLLDRGGITQYHTLMLLDRGGITQYHTLMLLDRGGITQYRVGFKPTTLGTLTECHVFHVTHLHSSGVPSMS